MPLPTANPAFDTNNVITGQNGRLYLEGVAMANVNTFSIRITYKNASYVPAGSPLEFAIPTGLAVTLTCKETVMYSGLIFNDGSSPMMASEVGLFQYGVADSDRANYSPRVLPINFKGEIQSPAGSTYEVFLENCIPDGDIDWLKMAPEEIFEREWTFKVNSMPTLTKTSAGV